MLMMLSSLATQHAISQLIADLNNTFSPKDLGPLHYFLGIEAKFTPKGGLFHSQTKYITNLFAKASMSDCKPSATPMTSGFKLTKIGTDLFDNPSLYLLLVHYNTQPSLGLKFHSLSIKCVNSCTNPYNPTGR